MKPLVFHSEAAQESKETARFDEDIRQGLGEEFRHELQAALERVEINPFQFTAEVGNIRICPLRRFPYALYFEVLEDQVWIAALGHTHRRPGYWAERKSKGHES